MKMSQVSYALLFQETKSPCAVTRETRALRTRKEATPVTIFVPKTIQKQATKKNKSGYQCLCHLNV